MIERDSRPSCYDSEPNGAAASSRMSFKLPPRSYTVAQLSLKT